MRRILLAFSFLVVATVPAFAGLTTFQQYVGQYGYSSDGFGSTSQSGTISASVPAGSTVVAAYLYSASFGNTTGAGIGGTLGGVALTGGNFVFNPTTGSNQLGATRWDVTSIVAPVINGGVGGVYDFAITETDDSQDGEALVVVFTNPALGTNTFAILDGFSAVGGDSFTATFAAGLDPTTPGFFAEMALGIGFSCCTTQQSNLTVNGTLISANAGNHDDGLEEADGSLITVGGFNDPFSPLLPGYDTDHERYNLVPRITNGDTQITVLSDNPSANDNIFLAAVFVNGEGTVTTPNDPTVPEPSTFLLMGGGMLAIVAGRRRLKKS